MALVVAGIQCDVYDIDFKNKPQAMLDVSPKGTVPVLVVCQDNVLEESLEVMLWALKQNDPQGWLAQIDDSLALIKENDGAFKKALDRYKYPNRFPDEDCSMAQEQGAAFLKELNNRLAQHQNLLSDDVRLADIGVFPFVRQFANVDRAWFEAQDIPALQQWLSRHLESTLFVGVMKKHKTAQYLLIN